MSDYLDALTELEAHGKEACMSIAATILDEEGCPLMALAIEADTFDVEEARYGNREYLADGKRWIVCDDSDADALLDEYLEILLDDGGCVEGADSPYFDRERWKRDAAMDGRGHFLAGYDGEEREQGEFFLYRID